MQEDRRTSVRHRLSMPIRLSDGTWAVTRDISPLGLFFHTRGDLGAPRWTGLECGILGIKFVTRAQVVRVEHTPAHTGAAVRLFGQHLVPLPWDAPWWSSAPGPW